MNFFTIPEGGRLLFWGLSVVRASLACFAMAFIGALTGTAGGLIPLVSATGTIVAPLLWPVPRPTTAVTLRPWAP